MLQKMKVKSENTKNFYLGKHWLINFILIIIPVCQVFIKSKGILISYTYGFLLQFILFWEQILKMGAIMLCTL